MPQASHREFQPDQACIWTVGILEPVSGELVVYNLFKASDKEKMKRLKDHQPP